MYQNTPRDVRGVRRDADRRATRPARAINAYGASVELTDVAVEGNNGNGESNVLATMGRRTST